MPETVKLFAWKDKDGDLLMAGGDKYPHIRLYPSRDSAIADLNEKLIIPDEIQPHLDAFDIELEDCVIEERDEDGP